MKYVRYKGLTNNNVTTNKVYEVLETKSESTLLQFTIINDTKRIDTYVFWFNSPDLNLFEDVTLRYARRDTINEILE